MRLLLLRIAVAVPSSLFAAAVLAGLDILGTPVPVTAAATVAVFYLTAYALASYIGNVAAHRG
jgi:hypothetical protein